MSIAPNPLATSDPVPSLPGSPLTRRTFLQMVGGSTAMLAAQGVVNLWPTAARAESPLPRRNVIFFTTDQQQELSWFPEGWEAANLPGLTRLRSRGVSFTRAFTNTAMCTPSRTTLFTGLYPAQHGNVDTLSEEMSQSEQEHQLDPSLPNIATVLKAAGYDVVWKGKWHLSKGTEQPDGGHTSDDISRYGMDGWNSPDAGGDAKMKNYAGGTTDHDGRFLDGSTWQPPVGNPEAPDAIFTQADGPVNAEFERNSIMAFLRHKINNPGGNPFCLIICMINPHDVLGCPGLSVAQGGNGTYIEGGYYGRPDGSSPWSEQTGPLAISLPPTVNERLNLNLKPRAQEAFLISSAGLGPVATNQQKLQYLNFYGNLMKLGDRHLSKILDLLDGLDPSVPADQARAVRDNSWFIFSSDHGDMAMAHGGMRQKSFQFYEETARIPLVWSNPVDFPAGRTCPELVSHVDFLPTLCAMLDIDATPYAFKGVDYSPLIRNPEGPAVQKAILFTYDDIWCGQDAANAPDGIAPPPNRLRAIREKESKFVHYFDGAGVEPPQEEFYDLRTKERGGIDTDIDSGLGSTGRPVEYKNLSAWAEDRRPPGQKLITPELEATRTRLEQDLQSLIKTKLAPLPPRPAVSPQNFEATFFQWTDAGNQPQSSLQLTWLSRSSTQYQLQSSRDLKTWEAVGPLLPGTNGPLWVDTPADDPSVHYRLVWSPREEPVTPQPDLSTGG